MFDTHVEDAIDQTGGAASPYVVHHQTSPDYDFFGDNVYFPINHQQFRHLIGQTLTHLDAMGLSDRARRAAKTLLTQDAWRWWGEACDNATTSAQGCIAPIVMHSGDPNNPTDERGAISNRWGWESEEAYLESRAARRVVTPTTTSVTWPDGSTGQTYSTIVSAPSAGAEASGALAAAVASQIKIPSGNLT